MQKFKFQIIRLLNVIEKMQTKYKKMAKNKVEEKKRWEDRRRKGKTWREVKSMRLDPAVSLSNGYHEGKQAVEDSYHQLKSHSSRY